MHDMHETHTTISTDIDATPGAVWSARTTAWTWRSALLVLAAQTAALATLARSVTR